MIFFAEIADFPVDLADISKILKDDGGIFANFPLLEITYSIYRRLFFRIFAKYLQLRFRIFYSEYHAKSTISQLNNYRGNILFTPIQKNNIYHDPLIITKEGKIIIEELTDARKRKSSDDDGRR